MKVALIDYGAGNIQSASNALAACGAEITLSADPAALAAASHIVLPGVGAFRECRRQLAARKGLIEALHAEVADKGKPFLGICVGMQLMAERGREFGETPGLGWIAGEITALEPSRGKIPHIGWADVTWQESDGLPVIQGRSFYFVHSYHLTGYEPKDVIGESAYGGTIVAAVRRDNMMGVQFHPEKSGAAGLQFLSAFLAWRP
ncbi:MAG TPA: imidazole glycerol phosphate synthase subunit HisH [Dongiaceae bacterium]|nr:imidazole glycerol phosphate synthase subunit HisH [Dongiaceae bacterium]